MQSWTSPGGNTPQDTNCTATCLLSRKLRRTRHAGHCWRSRDELISDVLLWTPTHGRAKAGWPARTYIQQLSEDTGCCPEDLPRAMNDREEWRERVRDIRATSATWWWWWWWWNVSISTHLGHLFMCSSTSLQYPGHQACNLNLLCVAAVPQWILSFTLLIMSFLKI